jgi:hypothetical protein
LLSRMIIIKMAVHSSLLSIPRVPAGIVIALLFVYTCVKVSELNKSSAEHDSFFVMWRGFEVVKIVALVLFAGFICTLEWFESAKDENTKTTFDALYYTCLSFVIGWVVIDLVYSVTYLGYITSLPDKYSAFLFILSLLTFLDLAIVVAVYRFLFLRGRSAFGGLAKMTSPIPGLTDPLQQFVYMHLPAALTQTATQPLHEVKVKLGTEDGDAL